MKTKFTIILLFLVLASGAQSRYQVVRGSGPFTYIYKDSTAYSQFTVAEYEKFLAVFEVPFSDMGAGQSKDLFQHHSESRDLLAFLKDRYKKPLKYIFSTHWHQHSLSGLTPFLEEGAELFTSASSWQYLIANGFMTADTAMLYRKQIHQVTKDSLVLKGTSLPVQIIFLDSSYANKPTKDYLFFYFPSVKTLMSSCMCAISSVTFTGSPVYSDRLIDLEKSINTKKLDVKTVMGQGRQTGPDIRPEYKYSDILNYMQHGRTVSSVSRTFSSLQALVVRTRMDSLMNNALSQNLGGYYINTAVYVCLREGRYQEALELARMLNVYAPGVDSYIDTMGEATLAAGNTAMAERYDRLLRQNFPRFKNGGMENWRAHQKNGWK